MKNILLIEPKSADFNIFSIFKIPRMGLAILGTKAKKAGYNVRIIYEELVPLKKEHIIWADIIGFSLTTSTAPQGYKLARMARTLEGVEGKYRPIIFGGAHASFEVDECMREADYVFRGEADDTFVPFLDALNAGADVKNIPGLAWRDEGGVIVQNPLPDKRTDMATVPAPDWTLLEGYSMNKVNIEPVMTSRGCPFDCTFCSVTPMFGKKYRLQPVEHVIEELKASRARQVFFYDDHFAANKKRSIELLKRIIEEKKKGEIKVNGFSAQVRSDIGKYPELLDLMKEAGFNTLFIGFESVNPKTLELFHKGQNVGEIQNAIKEIHKRKIRIHGMFVFGSDADDMSTFASTLKFARHTSIETVQFLILTPLPGAVQYKEMEAQGRIFNTNWTRYDTFNAVFLPKEMTPYELQMGTIKAMRKFYSPLRAFLWLFKGSPIVFFFRMYGMITLIRWWMNNRKKLANMRKDSKNVFIPDGMRACRPAVGVTS